MTTLPDRERAIRQRLKDEFEHYAPRCLKIRTKTGKVEPFVLNEVQRYIDGRLEAQLVETGWVRALILKGRQQGCSTYVGGRFYWKTTHRRGCRCFILTHEQDATNNLFGMVERYHENCPVLVRPNTGSSNAKELSFSDLDSGYAVGTAGTKAVGRSQTIQLFHGSEVAFWPFADTHATGVIQAIPLEPGTECILESTANGLGNYFHEQWQKAERGEGDYIAIFVPWFWTKEYRRPVPAGFTLDDAEQDYMEAHGLDLEQMVWRRAKIAELGDEWKFRQEYPATAAEAFQTSGEDSFIKPETVLRARKCEVEDDIYSPSLGGCDPARFGDDDTVFAVRRGRKVASVEWVHGKDTMEVAGRCINYIKEYRLAKMFIDVGGLGAGIYDRLVELGYQSTVVAVNFGERALDDTRYVNRRAEMWGEMRDWLKEQPASIPDDDVIHGDMTGPRYGYDSKSRYKLERKEDMRKRGLSSPDSADAIALTFAMPVGPAAEHDDRDDYGSEPDRVSGY